MDGRRLLPKRVAAVAVSAVALGEVAAAVVLTVAVGWSWQDALDAFVVTNSAMGLSFSVCGGLLTWHRTGNPIGWLLILDGLGHATTAVCAPLAVLLVEVDAPLGLQRAVVTVFGFAWPWSIALFLPLALLLFPDGRPASPPWGWVVLATVVTAPLFVAAAATEPTAFADDGPLSYFTIRSYDDLSALWVGAELRTVAVMALALASLVVRYRRGSETLRRQLLWLMLATIVVLVVTSTWGLVAGTPIGVLFAIPLIPVAIVIAVLRHGLLDIRLVVSRTLVYLLLSVAVFGAYAGLVSLLDTLVLRRAGAGVLAALAVALAFGPARSGLQRVVDRAMYGDRRDPARAMSRLGERLVTDEGEGLAGVLAAVRESLLLPYVAVVADDDVLASSDPLAGLTQPIERVPLRYAGRQLGELVLGLRKGESRLAPADRRVLALIAAPLALAVHATTLSGQLQASRQLLVAAREEERRRLQRDLHDGLGPALTGVAFHADAAANLVSQDPDEARRLLGSLRAETRSAIAEVRRIVHDLRPPALDELGLIGALQRRVAQLTSNGPTVTVQLDASELPRLPAAVEVAAYRIVTEAMTNAVRHAAASRLLVRVWCDADLHVEVNDDGRPANGPWPAGVGMTAMRERAAELGGACEAGPTPSGGRVAARLPLQKPAAVP